MAEQQENLSLEEHATKNAGEGTFIRISKSNAKESGIFEQSFGA